MREIKFKTLVLHSTCEVLSCKIACCAAAKVGQWNAFFECLVCALATHNLKQYLGKRNLHKSYTYIKQVNLACLNNARITKDALCT